MYRYNTNTSRTLTAVKMWLSLLFLASLTITCLPLSQSYREGARSESCYNMLVMHTDFLGQIVRPGECSSPCQYQLRMVGKVVGENNLTVEEFDSTTYRCGEVYQCKWKSWARKIKNSFMNFSCYTHVYMHAHTHVCTCTHTYAHAHPYTHMLCVRAHTHTHTHTHIQYNYLVILAARLRASWLRPGRTLPHLKREAQYGGRGSLTPTTSTMQLSATGAILPQRDPLK